jgi:hypothetical protein
LLVSSRVAEYTMTKAPRGPAVSCFAPLLVLAMGCALDATGVESAQSTDTTSTLASPETRQAIGVDSWRVTMSGGVTVVDGLGAGKTIVRFRRTLSKDSTGNVSGVITSTMAGHHATARYTVHANGTLTVEENELPNERDAAAAARRAVIDLQSPQSGGTATLGLRIQNLVSPAPDLVPGLGGSGTARTAAACGSGDCATASMTSLLSS